MSNNSIESQSPLSWILAGPCFANKLTVLLWVFRNRLTPCVYQHPVNTTHLYDFVQCWTNVEDVGPTLYKCYTNVLCLLGRRTFSQTLYICAMLVQCWASVADVGLTLKQRWVSIRWSSIQSYNQVTSSTTLYCMLKAYTHASLEPDSIFNTAQSRQQCMCFILIFLSTNLHDREAVVMMLVPTQRSSDACRANAAGDGITSHKH